MEDDPLFITNNFIAPKFSNQNRRGRPCNHETTRFCSPPRSIISQKLSEERKYLSFQKKPQKDCDNIAPRLYENNTVREYVYLEDVGLENNLLIDINKDETKESDHDLNEERKLTFDSGSFSCQQTGELLDDSKVHKKTIRYTCDFKECTYSTNISSNLTKHKRKHTNEKPYLCELCSFKSSFISSLKVHRRIHTSERPFCCEHCGYRCNSSSNLKKHLGHKHSAVLL